MNLLSWHFKPPSILQTDLSGILSLQMGMRLCCVLPAAWNLGEFHTNWRILHVQPRSQRLSQLAFSVPCVHSLIFRFLSCLQARKWKKNLLRTFIVLTTAGIAIALKDDFAYVSAIVGSIGSATLGFILPCIFHLVLCKDSNTMLIKVKDCLFIAFGIIGGVVGVTITIEQIVQQFTKS